MKTSLKNNLNMKHVKYKFKTFNISLKGVCMTFIHTINVVCKRVHSILKHVTRISLLNITERDLAIVRDTQ